MLLRAHGIVVRHHPSLPAAVDGVSIEVARGEVVALVGANGSGKSTLARALVGLVELETGSVDAGSPGTEPRVGLLLQDPAAQLVAACVADEVALGPESSGVPASVIAERVAALLAANLLTSIAGREPRLLSGGQQQRVAVAALEACDVDVLVLDEPTALLDVAARLRCRRLVRELAAQRGVVWITQEPDELGDCDRIVVLDAGRVAWSGTPAQYVAAPEVAATFGLELPAPARIAHALAARGAWPAGRAIPTVEAGLHEALAGG